METSHHLFFDLTQIFIAAVAGGFLAWRLKLPLILGFVLGGIVLSPFTPGLHLSEIKTFEEMAEVGVVLLMFSIGVEFSLSELLSVKWVAVLGGSCGIALSLGLSIGISKLFGWNVTHGIVIGATVSVASTMVLARLLSDRGGMSSTSGKVKIGITLFEDLAVVFMTVILPVLAGSGEDRFTEAAKTLGKAILFIIPLTFVAMKVIPVLFRRAKDTEDSELSLLVAVAICLGTAALSERLGFSRAFGAFLAGFAISGSKDLHHAHAQLIPLRDAFVALFFVSLGTLIQPNVLAHSLPLLGVMLVLIIPGKFAIWMLVVKMFRYSNKTAISVAAGLTQIGELSFVVVQVARDAKMVGDDVFNATLAASLISIFINVFIVRAAQKYIENKEPTST